MKIGRSLASLALLLFCGCAVPFLRPLATPETVTTDHGLVGTWLAEGETRVQAVVTEAPRSVYDVTLDVWEKDEHRTTLRLDARLVRLGEATYADLSLAESERSRLGNAYGVLALPVHQIFRIERDADTFRARGLSEKWLDEKLLRGGVSLAHERVPVGGDDALVVSARTDEMQRFFRERARRAEAFDDGIVFHRRRPASESDGGR